MATTDTQSRQPAPFCQTRLIAELLRRTRAQWALYVTPRSRPQHPALLLP